MRGLRDVHLPDLYLPWRDAVQSLRARECDLALAGGVSLILSAETMSALRPLAQARGLGFVADLPPELPSAWGDSMRVGQVLKIPVMARR